MCFLGGGKGSTSLALSEPLLSEAIPSLLLCLLAAPPAASPGARWARPVHPRSGERKARRGAGSQVFVWTYVFASSRELPTSGTAVSYAKSAYDLVAQMVKNLPAMQETLVQSLGQKTPWRSK